jgi:hypothetical protein
MVFLMLMVSAVDLITDREMGWAADAAALRADDKWVPEAGKTLYLTGGNFLTEIAPSPNFVQTRISGSQLHFSRGLLGIRFRFGRIGASPICLPPASISYLAA